MKGTMLKISTTLLLLTGMAIAGDGEGLNKVLDAGHRSAEHKARDTYRKPAQVLEFLGLRPDMTVAEIFPGSGWYTEILAPYLKANGQLIAVTYDRNPETQKKWQANYNKKFEDTFVAHPDVYGKIQIGQAAPGQKIEIAPDGTVDMILDFRNAHNWIKWDADAMAVAWNKALKKGGVVGLVDHRLNEDQTYDEGNGYIHTAQIVEIMERNGFKLADSSDILANPKDTKDHPKGVWTLPPTLALGDQDAAKYKEIGESDRMLLKFVKQ